MNSQKTVWNRLYKDGLRQKKEAPNIPRILEGKSILEVGVGTGKTLKAILKQNPKSVIALDFSEEALKKVKESIKSKKVMFLKADITNFTANKKFDVIVCYYIFNNLREKDRKKAVNQMNKSLNYKGIILFEDLAAGDFREDQKRKDGLIYNFPNEKEVKSLFKQFSNIKISTKTFSPLRKERDKKRRIINAIIKRSW